MRPGCPGRRRARRAASVGAPRYAPRKPTKRNGKGGRPLADNGGRDRRRAGQRGDSDSRRERCPDEREPGVADERRARIGHQRDVVPGPQARHQLGGTAVLVVGVVRERPGGDAVVPGERGEMARVLGCDDGDVLQQVAGADRQVVRIPDRDRDEAQGSAHAASIGCTPPSLAHPSRRTASDWLGAT